MDGGHVCDISIHHFRCTFEKSKQEYKTNPDLHAVDIITVDLLLEVYDRVRIKKNTLLCYRLPTININIVYKV